MRQKLLFIVSIVLCYFLFAGISYTDDISTYYSSYVSGEGRSYSDMGYMALESICHGMNLSFGVFYNLVLLIELSLISFFFYKNKVNPIIGMLFVVAIFYVQMANQVRYFIAFGLFLLSVYYLHINHKRNYGLLLVILSFLFHNGIIGLLVFHPIFIFIKKKNLSKKNILLLYIVVGLFLLFLFGILGQFMGRFDEKYTEAYAQGDTASVLGMLYIVLMPVVCLVLSYRIQIRYQKRLGEIIEEDLAIFALSLFPIIYLIASFSGVQIVNARYVNVFFIVWVLTYLKYIQRNKFGLRIALLFILVLFLKYGIMLISFGLSGENDITKAVLIWQSKGQALYEL